MTRINYTGRKKISRKDAFITVVNNDHSSPSFKAELRLNDYNLPDNAQVCIEAYRQTSWMRFDFGTIGNLVVQKECLLSEFDTSDGVLFRVKVTSDEKPHGKLLAAVNGIRPRKPEQEDQNKIPLLSVRSQEIDSIWKMDYSGDEPLLLINKGAGDKDTIVLSPEFRSLVLPAIMREILTYILYRDRPSDLDDLNDWKVRWLQFSRLLPGVGDEIPPEDNEIKIAEWIDDAVASFSRRQKDLDVFLGFWQGRESL